MDPKPTSQTLETQKKELDRQIAVMSVLADYGLISEQEDVDLDELALKKEELKVLHKILSNEAAIALAYLDIQVKDSREAGVSIEDIIDSIPEGLIASLVTNRVARNDREFIGTIFANLKVAMSSRSEDFSEILLSVISARQASIEKVVTGVVDSQSSVVITDTEFSELKNDSHVIH